MRNVFLEKQSLRNLILEKTYRLPVSNLPVNFNLIIEILLSKSLPSSTERMGVICFMKKYVEKNDKNCHNFFFLKNLKKNLIDF